MNKTVLIIVTIFMIGSTLGYGLYQLLKSRKYLNKLTTTLFSEDYDKFDEMFNSDDTKKRIPPYDKEFLLLNKALLQSNRQDIENSLIRFDKIKMSAKQEASVYSKAFYFYLTLNDENKCKKYYDLLIENPYYNDRKNLERVYNTYILKKYDYLEETIKEAENNPNLYSIVSDMYFNKGDTVNANLYQNKFKEIMKR